MSHHSPESPPTQSPSAHSSGTSTASPTFSNGGRGKRIYQSISSVFSRHTSPVFDDSPDISLSNVTQLPAPEFLPSPDNSKAEAPPALNSGHLDAMEEVEEGSSDDHSPQPAEVSPEVNLSRQPQSDCDELLRDTGAPTQATQRVYIVAPPIEEVRSAHSDLKNILKPQRVIAKGYKDPEFDELFKSWLLSMKQFMWTYINPDSKLKGRWTAASLAMANNLEKGPAHARELREWT